MFGTDRGHRRRRLRPRTVTAGICALALAAPAAAVAGQDDIYAGTLSGDAWGPRHSLSSVWATWYAQDQACLNANNSDGSGWAGASVCAHSQDTNKGHAYCACQLRQGYAFVNGCEYSHVSTGYWRQFW